MCYLSKNLQNTSRFVTLFSAHGDVVVGFAIFHIVYSKKKKKGKKKEKGTPPKNVNVGGHPMESVSHGLRKEKRWGGVPKLYKKSTNVPKFQRTRNRSHLFIMEDSKSPLPVVDMKQPPLKIMFLSLFYK